MSLLCTLIACCLMRPACAEGLSVFGFRPAAAPWHTAAPAGVCLRACLLKTRHSAQGWLRTNGVGNLWCKLFLVHLTECHGQGLLLLRLASGPEPLLARLPLLRRRLGLLCCSRVSDDGLMAVARVRASAAAAAPCHRLPAAGALCLP